MNTTERIAFIGAKTALELMLDGDKLPKKKKKRKLLKKHLDTVLQYQFDYSAGFSNISTITGLWKLQLTSELRDYRLEEERELPHGVVLTLYEIEREVIRDELYARIGFDPNKALAADYDGDTASISGLRFPLAGSFEQAKAFAGTARNPLELLVPKPLSLVPDRILSPEEAGLDLSGGGRADRAMVYKPTDLSSVEYHNRKRQLLVDGPERVPPIRSIGEVEFRHTATLHPVVKKKGKKKSKK